MAQQMKLLPDDSLVEGGEWESPYLWSLAPETATEPEHMPNDVSETLRNWDRPSFDTYCNPIDYQDPEDTLYYDNRSPMPGDVEEELQLWEPQDMASDLRDDYGEQYDFEDGVRMLTCHSENCIPYGQIVAYVGSREFEVRSVPQDRDSEMQLLSAIIFDNKRYEYIESTVFPNNFFMDNNKRIFEVMGYLHERGRPITKKSISRELESRGIRQENDLEYLSVLEETPRPVSVQDCADSIREKYLLRKAINLSRAVLRCALDERAESGKVISRLSNDLAELVKEKLGEPADDSFNVEDIE